MQPHSSPLAGIPAPRFDGASLLNLAATLAAALGVRTPYPPLAEHALRERMLAARTIVLWLIDGLGVEPLQRLAPDGALANAMVGELNAIFPSSTAPTLTMLASGRSPAVHAVPEWFVWFDELGAIFRTLPLDARSPAAQRLPLADAAAIYDWPSLHAQSARPTFAVLPRSIAASAYSRYAYAGARRLPFADDEGFFAAVRAAVDACRDGGYVYAYEDRFDQAAHEHGAASDAARAVVRALDRRFERLAAALADSGALLVVTADHGFIDIAPEHRLELQSFPRLARSLERPLAGGPRLPICHVRAGCADGFAALVDAELGGRFAAVASDALIDAGWLGPEAASPRLRARLGTHVLLPTADAYLIDHVAGERPQRLIGVHGGAAAAELRVPMIMAG